MVYQVIGSEVSRSLVWGLMFVHLARCWIVFTVCCSCRCRRRQTSVVSVFVTPVVLRIFKALLLRVCSVVWLWPTVVAEPCGRGGEMLGRDVSCKFMVKSQCFSGPGSQGCDLHKWFLGPFPLRQELKGRGAGRQGKVHLPGGMRLWKNLFPGGEGFVLEDAPHLPPACYCRLHTDMNLDF